MTEQDQSKAIEAWKSWYDQCVTDEYEIGQWIARCALNRLGVEYPVTEMELAA